MKTDHVSRLLTAPRLFTAVVGSRAYGLANTGSDTDKFGVALLPATVFLGLHPPAKEALTYHSTGTADDITVHEAGKYLSLALRGNPSVLETFWLTDYLDVSPLGRSLLELRHAVLSRREVASSYLGYCSAQAHGIAVKQATKHEKFGRHLYRLAEQATGLWTTGRIDPVVADPEACRAFGRSCANGETAPAEALIARLKDTFEQPTPLPVRAEQDRINDWLVATRKATL